MSNDEQNANKKAEKLNLDAMSMSLEENAHVDLYRAAAMRMDDKLCQSIRDKCHALLDARLDFIQQAVDVVLIAHGHKK